MLRTAIYIFVMLFAGAASAQSCPDFYRFVDFGFVDKAGTTYRGGAIARAEGFEGGALLIPEKTVCKDVPRLALDGHGISIPVVTSIDYAPAETGLNLTELNISSTVSAETAANEHAQAHRTAAEQASATLTRTDGFLCVSQSNSGLSCQIHSPYPGNMPLVIYCEGQSCAMPALAIDATLLARAAWPIEEGLLSDPELGGEAIIKTVAQIHAFLTPLSDAF